MRELRRHPRFPEDVVLKLRTGPQGEAAGKGCVVNLSQGGAGVESEIPLEKGQLVFFELTIPLSVRARVTHVSPEGKRYRYGFQFQKLDFWDRMFLKRHLKRHLAK